MATVRIGDTNVGYKVVAVKKGELSHISVVLAEKASEDCSSEYVTWQFDHSCAGFRNGIYTNDRAEAQRVFESRTS